MTATGWLLMLVSCGSVIFLTAYCYYRVLFVPTEHIHAPLEIDTQDTDT